MVTGGVEEQHRWIKVNIHSTRYFEEFLVEQKWEGIMWKIQSNTQLRR